VGDSNPWVVTATVTEPGADEQPGGALDPPAGPDRPQPRAVTPPHTGGLPVVPVGSQVWPPASAADPEWWWAGCHGGAGATTLLRLTQHGRDAQRTWPLQPGRDSKVVLVARTHVDGLRAARLSAQQWASGSLPDQIKLLGLVLAADAPGRLPRELAEQVQVVRGTVPGRGRSAGMNGCDSWLRT
jgi:hypothetical protein